MALNNPLKTPLRGRRAVFLDRDGCINAMVYNPDFGIVDSPYHPNQFTLLPGVAEAVRAINTMGLLAVVISNQPGVAKGKCTLGLLDAVTQKMRQELSSAGAHLDGVYYCLHHPEGVVQEYHRVCDCRKPAPGLLLQAARELNIDLSASCMVGDGVTDILAGQAAGCRTVWLGSLKSDISHVMVEMDAHPDRVAADLQEAVKYIQEESLVDTARRRES